MLTARQIESYREHGYLVVEGVVDAARLAVLRGVVDDLIERAREVSTHTEAYDLEDSHTAADPRVRRIKQPHLRHPAFAALVGDPAVVALLRDLIGPDIRLQNTKLNLKGAGYGAAVEWHQDWAFYPHTNDDVLATGLYLDDCDLANGPLLVVPGSHRGPTWDHHAGGYFCGAMDPGAAGLDASRAVPLTGPAGSLTIHHARLVHGSAPNVSARPRRLLLHEYRAADAWPLVGVADFEAFEAQMVAGRSTLVPRIVPAPVRMPFPVARHQGSIYENQRGAARRYFDAPAAAGARAGR
jgi:ectoine hydroxylase-related dioxygenase (phytanoyl-CoA dioxygenase family)